MLKRVKILLQRFSSCDTIVLNRGCGKEGKCTSHYQNIVPHDKNKENILCKKKEGKIMCKAGEVAKIVVNKCIDRDFAVNTQKLQKLLVLMQVDCIRRSGKPLFKEDIRIWDCGVAIKEVDDEFSDYAEGFSEKQEEFITLLEAEAASVDYILNSYGKLDAFELSQQPDNKKVEALGVVSENTKTPHISYQILMGAFADDTDGFYE